MIDGLTPELNGPNEMGIPMLIASAMFYGIVELCIYVVVPAGVACYFGIRHGSQKALQAGAPFAAVCLCAVVGFAISFALAGTAGVPDTLSDYLVFAAFCSAPFIPVGYIPSLLVYLCCYHACVHIEEERSVRPPE